MAKCVIVRVLYWTELYHPYIGGVEVIAAQLLPALAARGFEFQIVTGHGSLNLPNEATHHGIPIHRLPFHTALTHRHIDQIARLCHSIAQIKRDFRPDLVHIHLSDPSIYFHLQTRGAHPAPTLVSIAVGIPPHQDAPLTLLGRALNEADWITAYSRAMLDEIHEFVPSQRTRSSIIYPALESPALAPAPLDFNSPRLLCIGRLVRDKGFDLAIDALPRVLEAFPNTRLLIAGDGPAREELRAQANALGVAHALEFLGWVAPEKIPGVINRAVIVLVPSRWKEAFGLVALQAAQMARPAIATRMGGLPEVVAAGETGFIVEKENPRALGDAILNLLNTPECAVRMGSAGRMRASEMFGWDRCLSAHADLYENIVKKGSRYGSKATLYS